MNSDFPATRWSLVAAAADGAGTLLALYAEPIARYLAMKLPEAVRSGRIDDVVQETLLWLAAHPDVLSRARPGTADGGQPSRFRWYVMTLAFNQARNALRRLHDPVVDASAVEDAAEIPPEAARDMDRAWAQAVLADAWRDLAGWAAQGVCETEVPELTRLHLGEGLGVREAAERAGLPLATCHRRIARGRALLRQAIVDRLRTAGETANDEQAACDALLDLLR